MMTERPLDAPEQNAAASPSAGTNDYDAPEGNDISLLDLLIVFVERKRIVLWITGTFALLAIVISLLLPFRYTATVTLMPPQQNISMAAALGSQLGNLGGMASLAGGGLGIKNPNDMYISMLRSRTVEDSMVQRFGLMKEYKQRYESGARGIFEAHTVVDGSGKDNLIHISVEDHDPHRAAELANGYVEQFRDLSQHLAITEASQRRVFFERELEQAKDNLANAEEALKQTELSTGVIQPDSQARALIESAATLRAEITAREVQIQGMQTYATGQNSQLVEAQKELESLRAQLAKLGGSEDGSSGEFMLPKGRVPEAGMEYVRKLRDVKYYETIFDILARQFETAKLDEAKEGSLIQVIDPAIVPDRRSFPKRGLIVIATTVAGFILGVSIALVQAALARLKDDPAAAAKLSQMRETASLRR
jgi:tyrosine-protein kinase Etk/Wzc